MCLNKCDLVTPQELEQWRDRLSGWGYEPMFISVRSGAVVQEATKESQKEVFTQEPASQHLTEKIEGYSVTFEDKSLLANSTARLAPLNPVHSPLPNFLLRHLQGKITVICGPSGVGKSSLINQLIRP